jgi:hypothetical protein
VTTIVNGYTSLEHMQTTLSIRGVEHDERLKRAINASSRQIDGHTGRRFWQDSALAAYEFYADDAHTLCIPDGISTTTGLLVKTDDNDDGTFETTLTIGTDFILLPRNAALRVPAWPYEAVRLVNGSSFPMSSSGRPGVQITAKCGWPTTHPDDVGEACIEQASQLFKAPDAVFGAVQVGADGYASRIRQALNPMAAALLEPYVRVE